jgi:hypothetical protein
MVMLSQQEYESLLEIDFAMGGQAGASHQNVC